MTKLIKIVAPTECPSCGAELERINAQLFCTNDIDCPAQCAKKLQNFCSKLKLKGWGESTIEKLELNTVNDILVVDPLEYGFSDKMTGNLLSALTQRIEQGILFSEFISAMSIPLIGDSIGRKLEKYRPEDLTLEVCKSEGLGDKATANLLSWIKQEWHLYQDTWGSKLKTTIRQKSAISVCITGKLSNYKNRSEAETYLKSLGLEVKSSVTKALTYLICEEGDKTSSSCAKAIGYNIPILTIKDLEEKLKND